MKGETSVYVISGIIALAILCGIIWWGSANPGPSNQSPGSTETSTGTTEPLSTAEGATTTASSAMSESVAQNFMHRITIKTNKGAIVFETYDADAPNTVANFIKLADSGFYDGTLFHRVINGFMIQGGDPLTKDPSKEALWGTGNPGYTFADELDPNTISYQTGYVPGTVAMANSGPNTNGSQFFIMQATTSLPHAYTIFGKVISGMDAVNAIAATPVDADDRPLSPVTMESVTVATTTLSSQ